MKTNIFRTVMVIAIGAITAFGFGGCANEVKVPVSKVTLDKESTILPVNGTTKLTATVGPSDAKNKKVKWESSAPDFATVDKNGNVTAVAVGEATITVITVDGKKKATCAVTVSGTPESITVTPTKTWYGIGDELDTGGFVVEAVYDNGNIKISIPNSDVTVSGFDTTTAGEKTVTVTYLGKEADFQVAVLPVESLTVAQKDPEKTLKSAQDEPLYSSVLEDITVTAHYGEGKSQDITSRITLDDLSGFSSDTTGDKKITVTYQNKTGTFNVLVVGVSSIKINTTEKTKKRYAVDDVIVEDDIDGLTITVTYTDNTKATVTPGLSHISGFDSSKVGVKTVTVTYGGQTDTFTVTVYAVVTFNPNGGNSGSETRETHATESAGATVTAPPDPVLEGCIFDGWFKEATGGDKLVFPLAVSTDTTLYAQWSCEVIFNGNNGVWGSDIVKTDKVKRGTTVTPPSTNPTHATRTFYGWSTIATGELLPAGASAFNFATPVTTKITLYAKWNPKVTFEANGGTLGAGTSPEQDITWDTTVASPANNPTLTGWDFDGWFAAETGGTPLTFPLKITGDRTLHAQWSCEVTFNSNGGSTVNPVTVKRGNTVANPGTPSLTNCNFDGWFAAETGGTPLTFPLNITAHTTVHAQWSCTVTFNTNGGSTVSPETVKRNSTVSRPANDPTREGCYAFDGWYTAASGGTVFNFGDNITVHTTVYAQWEDDHDYGNWMETTAPTCTTAGVDTRTCSRDQNHKDTRPVAIVPTAHNFDYAGVWQVTTAASETKSKIETEICSHNDDHTRGMRLTDSRDGGRIYKIVKIGNQTWMAENLDYAAEGSRYYNDDETANKKYGRMYNWATAMAGAASSAANPSGVQGIAPVGWHIPSDAEWNALIAFVHSDNDLAVYTSENSTLAGKYLKAESGWYAHATYGNGEDTYGFAALPGGRRLPSGGFGSVNTNGFWWSSTQSNSSSAYYRYMSYDNAGASWYYTADNYFISVRCVMD
jgi:uncharacterized protein (TIGR02145 family)/uncharacterized repeat protein (TIGR02543 family)